MRKWSLPLVALVLVAAAALGYGLSRGARSSRPAASTLAAPKVVWAVGDGADGGAAALAVARRIATGDPDRVLYLGDVYEHGSAADFREHYDTVYGSLAKITAPTPGNHDWPTRRAGYDPYWRAKTGAPMRPWYWLRIAGWQVLSLNSEAPHGRGSAQLDWLERRLGETRGTCTLAFWHRPLMSGGSHGDQPDVAPLWNALRGKASLVLNGHEHDLQRMRPREGIVELVAGAGGHRSYPLAPDARRAFGDDRSYGALRLELRPGLARLSFVSADGAVLDRSAVRCARADG